MNSSPNKTILMIEHNEHLRQMTAALLERSGFHVLQAGDATEASEHWEAEGKSINVVLTDIVVPGRSGPELAREFLRTRPNLKVILTTGSEQTATLETRRLIEQARVIRKPYTMRNVMAAIEACFAEKG